MAEPQDGSSQEKPKIIVDDDWKAEAQREKERLAAEQAQKQAEQASAGPEGADQGQPGQELPQASFITLVNSLGVQAMMALGGVEDPETKRRIVDLDMARFHIDLLGVLQEKTKGNLASDEEQTLNGILYDLRMAYTQLSQQAAAQLRQQQGQGGPADLKT